VGFAVRLRLDSASTRLREGFGETRLAVSSEGTALRCSFGGAGICAAAITDRG